VQILVTINYMLWSRGIHQLKLVYKLHLSQIHSVSIPFPPDSTNAEDIQIVDPLLLDLSTLQAATDSFAESNKLGEGGFGAVYKVENHIEILDSLAFQFSLSLALSAFSLRTRRESFLTARKLQWRGSHLAPHKE
jgi:hypothetical protein